MPKSQIVQFLRGLAKISEGYVGISDRFPTVPHYILERGQPFESEPLTCEELAWTDQLLWRAHRPRQCYRNAQVAALTVPPPDGMTVHYVEGFIMPHGLPLPIEHAWLSLNGRVVDTTVRPGRGKRVFGVIPDGWEYYGVPLDTEICQHVRDRHSQHISLIDDRECRWPLLQDG